MAAPDPNTRGNLPTKSRGRGRAIGRTRKIGAATPIKAARAGRRTIPGGETMNVLNPGGATRSPGQRFVPGGPSRTQLPVRGAQPIVQSGRPSRSPLPPRGAQPINSGGASRTPLPGRGISGPDRLAGTSGPRTQARRALPTPPGKAKKLAGAKSARAFAPGRTKR